MKLGLSPAPAQLVHQESVGHGEGECPQTPIATGDLRDPRQDLDEDLIGQTLGILGAADPEEAAHPRGELLVDGAERSALATRRSHRR